MGRGLTQEEERGAGQGSASGVRCGPACRIPPRSHRWWKSRASRVTSASSSYGDCLEERPDDYAHDYTYNLSLIIERYTLRSSAFSRSHLINT
jgi:hypothetical protein